MAISLPAPLDVQSAAARYLRMSTDHQRYSIENQAAAIDEYAARRGFRIVQTYVDAGRSGLTLAGREGLKSLLADVVTGQAKFSTLLVYDVSRWGRFQDADESAYYEFICRRSGVRIAYCAEPFDNDGSATATIMKTIKRAMAGEYSRELSAKVFAGQCRLVSKGFRQGGQAGLGLRRLLLDPRGVPKAVMASGEYKSLTEDKVVLVRGPPEELALIDRIYRHFLDDSMTVSGIMRLLNEEGVLNHLGRPWTRDLVRQVLTNEKYIGNNVYNRFSRKLKVRTVRNPEHLWVRTDGAFQPLVDRDRFERVRLRLKPWSPKRTNESLLAALADLHRRVGRVSMPLIDAESGMAAASLYRERFGKMSTAYRLAGIEKQPPSDEEMIAKLVQIYAREGHLCDRLIRREIGGGGAIAYRRRFGSLPNAYRLAGFEIPKKPNDELLADLVHLKERLGWISERAINDEKSIASASVYRRRFGSISKAYELAGIEQCAPLRA